MLVASFEEGEGRPIEQQAREGDLLLFAEAERILHSDCYQ